MRRLTTTSTSSRHFRLYARVNCDHYSLKCNEMVEVAVNSESN